MKLSAYFPFNARYANRITIRPEVTYWMFRRSRISTSLRSQKKYLLMIVFNRIKMNENMTASSIEVFSILMQLSMKKQKLSKKNSNLWKINR